MSFYLRRIEIERSSSKNRIFFHISAEKKKRKTVIDSETRKIERTFFLFSLFFFLFFFAQKIFLGRSQISVREKFFFDLN